MRISLRPFARSRCLRVMSVLAWLMLVVNSLTAAPMPMAGSEALAKPAAMATMAGHHHHTLSATTSTLHHDDRGDCCRGALRHGCHCAAMCGNALAPALLVVIGTSAIAVPYSVLPPHRAPALAIAPPLRPPRA